MPLPSYIANNTIFRTDRKGRIAGWISAAALLAQGVLLTQSAGASSPGSFLFLAGTVAVAALVVIGWNYRSRFPYLDVLLVTAAAGGLGMLLGMRADEAIMASKFACNTSSLPFHDMNAMGAGETLWSWMTGGMLLFCIPACRLLCDRPCCLPSRKIRMGKHLLNYGLMLAGMIAAALWIAPPLHLLFHTSVVGAHISMVGGMVAGTYLGLKGGEWLEGERLKVEDSLWRAND